HDHMLQLVKPVLGSSQFEVEGLSPASTVIPAENLNLLQVENVLRLFISKWTKRICNALWLTPRP
ncbi:MAG: hypothetical protein AAF420_05660, partial [Pseudomonadota bacterium]